MSKIKHADDDMKGYCAIRLATVTEQFIRHTVETMIDTGKVPPDKFIDGDLPGPERLAGVSLGRHIAFSQNFQNVDDIKNILEVIGLLDVFYDCLSESDRAVLKALFRYRHDMIHTSVKLPTIDINRCFGIVLTLIKCIMSKIYPGGHHFYLYTGDCMSRSREYHEAITYYGMALAIRRDDPYILGKMGEAFAGLGLHERALECYNQALVLDPRSPVHVRQGDSLARLGRHGEALECYNQAMALNPDDPFVHTKNGESLAKLERFEGTCTGCRTTHRLSDAYAGGGGAWRAYACASAANRGRAAAE